MVLSMMWCDDPTQCWVGQHTNMYRILLVALARQQACLSHQLCEADNMLHCTVSLELLCKVQDNKIVHVTEPSCTRPVFCCLPCLQPCPVSTPTSCWTAQEHRTWQTTPTDQAPCHSSSCKSQCSMITSSSRRGSNHSYSSSSSSCQHYNSSRPSSINRNRPGC